MNTQTQDISVAHDASCTSMMFAPIGSAINGSALPAFGYVTTANASTANVTTKAPSRPPRAVPM